mmetsp:Transcript_540/g.931  ORF Transcript_540/g.931 Transcript_540/m.931 type:complete len:520 (+) Transcript_540:902-2461(+)
MRAHGVEGNRVAPRTRLVQLILGGQSDGSRDEGLVGGGVLENGLEGIGDAAKKLDGIGGTTHAVLKVSAVGRVGGGVIEIQQAELGQPLPRLPTIVGVAVVGEEEEQVVRRLSRKLHLHGRAEVAQQRRHRTRRDVGEYESLRSGAETQHRAGPQLASATVLLQVERDVLPIRTQQAHRDGDEHRLAGRALLAREAVRSVRRAVRSRDLQLRRARLPVPLGEVVQREVIRGGHGREEVVAGDRLAVVALEVQVHPLPKARFAQHCLIHADHLRALLIHSRRVKVVHLDVAVGPHRMCHRARVFAELCCAKTDDILDALHRARIEVRGELLVAKHGEPLLQRELEPVAAGDTIAGPVMEVLVADNALDAAVIRVCRRCRRCQNQSGVENVERLVLHRASIKVMHRHNVEQVQVVLQPEDFLIPLHGLLEALHRKAAFAELRLLIHKDAQLDAAAACGGEGVLEHLQVTRHKRKQVAGLLEGVHPHREVPSVGHVARLLQIPVAQQHGILRLVRLHTHRVL